MKQCSKVVCTPLSVLLLTPVVVHELISDIPAILQLTSHVVLKPLYILQVQKIFPYACRCQKSSTGGSDHPEVWSNDAPCKPPSIIYLCLKRQGTFRKHFPLATLKDNAFPKQVTFPDTVSFLPPFFPQELEIPPWCNGHAWRNVPDPEGDESLGSLPYGAGERISLHTVSLLQVNVTSCISYMLSLWTLPNNYKNNPERLPTSREIIRQFKLQVPGYLSFSHWEIKSTGSLNSNIR